MKRNILVIIIVCVFLLPLSIVGIIYALHYPSMMTNNPPKRSNNDFNTVITNKYPAMKSTTGNIFSISSVKDITPNWHEVQIKNTTTNDILYALLYDPTNSASGLQLVAGPSIDFSYDQFPTNSVSVPDNIKREFINDAK